MYFEVLVSSEKVVFLFQGVGLANKVFYGYSFFQKSIGTSACYAVFHPAIDKSFAIVQYPGINLSQEAETSILRYVFYHCLDSVGNASLTWSCFG